MNLERRKYAFIRLGEILRNYVNQTPEDENPENKYRQRLNKAIQKASIINPWFTPLSIQEALKSIGSGLEKEHLEKWIGQYPELIAQKVKPQKVGVVNAGNIPFVGFHDFLSVLLSGHIYYGKLSSKDEHLPKV